MKNYNHTVLIIEDNLQDQELIKVAYKRVCSGVIVQTVDNGLDAINYLMGEGKFADRDAYPYPTLIITDLKMPQADGFAVLEFLKENPDWAIIPTIVLSASADPDDVKMSYMLGASSYLVKPTTAEQLEEIIQLLNDYWSCCHVPEVDKSGKHLPTNSEGKIGARFLHQESSDQQHPVWRHRT